MKKRISKMRLSCVSTFVLAALGSIGTSAATSSIGESATPSSIRVNAAPSSIRVSAAPIHIEAKATQNNYKESNSSQRRSFYPGQVVPEDAIRVNGEANFFQNIAIPDTIFERMQGKSYKTNCTLPRTELRYLLCLHRDINGNVIVGEMVVNARIAASVLDILHELYKAHYPIERMRLIDYWDADDERAMRDNNTSCFNFRFISHTNKVSKHGQGLAIDINPLYNPYHKRLANGKEVIEPSTAAPYLNRSKDFPYKLQKGDLCYRLFKKNGFGWGGEWRSSKDYQHFEML